MKNKQIPKWIRPEKRMKKYKDYGIVDYVPREDPKWKNLNWTKYKIVVPTIEDKKEIQAAMEYFHDCKETDTEFVTVCQLVHEYETGDEIDGYSNIVVDDDLYHRLLQKTCPHPKEEQYNENGINYCKLCWKALEVTSFRERG